MANENRGPQQYDFCTKEDLENLEKHLAEEITQFPDHYTEGRDIQPIEIIEDWQLPHHLACALKCIARYGRRGNAHDDLLKAIWYLKRQLDLVDLQ